MPQEKVLERYRNLIAIFLLFTGCDFSRIPGLWQTFVHPTYRFTLSAPRTWELKRDGLAGADVVYLEGFDDKLFRANVNVVAVRRAPEMTLDRLADLSTKQLAFVLNEYQLLSRAPSRLGNFPAFELRGRSRAPEGARIIRTIVALTEDIQYVLTFACREEREGELQKTFDEIRRTFSAPANLSRD